MSIDIVSYNALQNAEHEFIIPTKFRIDEHFQKVAFQPEGYEGFPNILPFSWHRETFERLLRERATRAGSIIEFGTAQGGSTRQLARLAPTRSVYTFDVFNGIAADAAQPIDNRSPATQRPDIIDFTAWPFLPEMWKRFYTNVTVYEGLFKDSLPVFAQQHPDEKFILAYIDCNLYSSTREALDFIKTRMAPGSAIVIDDYSGPDQCDGARKAADEWFAANRSILKLKDASSRAGEGLFLVGE